MKVLMFGFKYYKRYLPLALFCLFIGFAYLLIALLFPQLSQIIIEYVIIPASKNTPPADIGNNVFGFIYEGAFGAPGTMQVMLNIAILAVLLMLVKHLLMYLRNNLYFYYGFKLDKDFRTATFQKLMSQSERVTAGYNTGDLLNIMHSDIISFRNLFVVVFPTILDLIFYIGIALFFLIQINPYLSILPFAFLPVQIYLFSRYIKRARAINTEIRDAAARLSMNVQENINGVRIVRSFASEEFEKQKFAEKSNDYRQKYFNQARFSTKFGLGFNSIRHLLYLSCIAAGSILAIEGAIGIGAFAAFIAYVFAILDSIMGIVNFTFEMQHYIVCGERISKFVTAEDLVGSAQDAPPPSTQPDISLENVGLTIDGKRILQDISLYLPYGKRLGIMGSTGSGKTSIIKLLSRFNDATDGTVKLGGVPITQLDLQEVRRLYGYTFQDVFLFSNTIDANIAYYDPKAPQETVRHYAKLACAAEFIDKMPEGYDTIVGERGTGLSGGQKQRISVARALLKQAPVLLLDDVTSALDMQTEKKLLRNLFREYKGKSIIITAHRATSVMRCDHIIVLSDDGRIAEQGSHLELMRQKGIYHGIFTKQAAAREEQEQTA